MDRAHRLGQKRTVNVYRLLTRDSLEDKIMGLQRFKLDVANSVVNQDNVSLKSMDAGRLLDLFSLDKQAAHGTGESASLQASCSKAKLTIYQDYSEILKAEHYLASSIADL